MSRHQKSNRYIWIDCQTTGPDSETDHLLKIAVIITDQDLNILAEGPNLVIHQTDEVFILTRAMTFTKQGLWYKLYDFSPFFLHTYLHIMPRPRKRTGGWGGFTKPPVFGGTVNPISTRGQIMPTTVIQAPQIFRPCDDPESYT